MATINHTTHTAIIKMSDSRPNLGHIAYAHPIIFKTVDFYNKEFLHDCLAGSFVIVKFRVAKADRRYLVAAEKITFDTSLAFGKAIEHIVDAYKLVSVLASEAATFALRFPKLRYTDVIAMPNVRRFGYGAVSYKAAAKVHSIGEAAIDFNDINPMNNEDVQKVFNFFEAQFAGKGEKMEPIQLAEASTPIAAKSTHNFADRIPLATVKQTVRVGKMYAKAGHVQLFEAMSAKARNNGAANVLALGPSGSGKTTFPHEFAAKNGLDCFKMDCATVRDPEEWLGYREAVDGSTVFVKSAFIEAVEKGNVVIVLDEFNRIEPWLQNVLYPLLDDTRKTMVHNIEVKVGPNVLFVAAMNVGEKFVGTFAFDAALLNRFDVVMQFDYPDKAVEAKIISERVREVTPNIASSVATIMSQLRNLAKTEDLPFDISTRTAIRFAELVVGTSLPLATIFDAVVLGGVVDTSLTKTVLDKINPSLTGFQY